MQEMIIKKTKSVDAELLMEAMNEKKKVKVVLEGYMTQVDIEQFVESHTPDFFRQAIYGNIMSIGFQSTEEPKILVTVEREVEI